MKLLGKSSNKSVKKAKFGAKASNNKKKSNFDETISTNHEGNHYADEVNQLKDNFSIWNNFYSDDSKSIREKEWNNFDKASETLCNKYSWGIPDDRSLKILKEFEPLIEIGAGKGYWAKLLREYGVDIVAYDKFINSETANCWSEVLSGGI